LNPIAMPLVFCSKQEAIRSSVFQNHFPLNLFQVK